MRNRALRHLVPGLAIAVVLFTSGVLSSERASATHWGHTHNWYWPQFSYSPLTSIPVYECINQDVAPAVNAWNATGLVLFGAPTASCSPPASNRIYYYQITQSSCVGQMFIDAMWTIDWVYDVETGAPPFYPMTLANIEIPTGCAQSSTVYAHELGHGASLPDHYAHDANGNPTNCTNAIFPATIMDCPGYTVPQPHDNSDLNLQYRGIPFNPSNRADEPLLQGHHHLR